MSLGKNILTLRKENNLSQEQLAEKLHVSRQTISKWELDETIPDTLQAKEISKIFKISLDNLTDNDIKNILNEKIINTERLAIKQNKTTKIILFTMYFLILITIIIIGIYWLTKKDFTNEYQTEYTCQIDNEDTKGTVNVSVTIEDDKTYTIEVAENNEITIEEKASTIEEVIKSLNTIKKIIINQGGTCR